MTVVPLPDTEGAVRTWVRSLGIPGVMDSVYFAPPSTPSTDVFVVVTRVGGGIGLGIVPLDRPRISFSVYAVTKKQAADAVKWLTAHLHSLEATRLDESTHCGGASVETVLWAPVPDSAYVRYIVDAVLTVRPA